MIKRNKNMYEMYSMVLIEWKFFEYLRTLRIKKKINRQELYVFFFRLNYWLCKFRQLRLHGWIKNLNVDNHNEFNRYNCRQKKKLQINLFKNKSEDNLSYKFIQPWNNNSVQIPCLMRHLTVKIFVRLVFYIFMIMII